MDFSRHNEEVKKLLQQEKQGCCERVLMSLAMNPRMILSDPLLNPNRITFQEYFENPQVMLEVQCRFREYCSESLISDRIMGFCNLPELVPYPDFQNVLEGVIFGCGIAYHGCLEPGTRICAGEDTKYDLLKNTKPLTEPLGGIVSTLVDYDGFFRRKKEEGYTYKGKPLGEPGRAGLGTDGPFTIACNLIGATLACAALLEEPEFMTELLDYITEGIIARIKALRRYYGLPKISKSFAFADDSIALLSIGTYEEMILPCHKKLITSLSDGSEPNSIHLCGDASRFFPLLVKELHISTFDTGFPIDHGAIVRELGPDITIYGGVHVETLRSGSPEAIDKNVRSILTAVKPYTRRFIIKEANNLSPGTPPENITAMHEAVKKYGYYQ